MPDPDQAQPATPATPRTASPGEQSRAGLTITASARSGRVLVIGSLNLDTALTVDHHPRPGETVSAATRTFSVGGKGANQAIAAARAGAAVSMVGAVGSDAEADIIIDGLRRAGVDTGAVQRHVGASGSAIVIVAGDGENVIVVSSGANATIDLDAARRAFDRIGPGDRVVLQNEIPAAATAFAARRARDLGAHVVWNAAPSPADRGEIPDAIDTLVVNEGELTAVAALVGVAVSGAPRSGVSATVQAVANELDVDVICTLGAAGAVAVLDGRAHEIPSPAVTAVDTTGAGDAFVGYFAALSAMDPAKRLRAAAAAGAAAVTRAGAAASVPAPEEVTALLAGER